MAQVGEGDKQERYEGQELIEQESRSIEFIEFMEKLSKEGWPDEDDDCETLQPSQDSDMIKAVDFTKDGINLRYAQYSFTSRFPVLRDKSGAHCSAYLRTGSSACKCGIKIHNLLNKFIKKWRGSGEKIDLKLDSEKQLKEFVENIERHFQFKIRASELKTYGYANQQQSDKLYCWRGKIDAIGVKKDGTIIVVDWRVCCAFHPYEFWDSASEFSIKLHQTLIYREIIIAQWKDFFKHKKDVRRCPKVGILIVPMASTILRGSAPRDCLDFTLLRKNRFFDFIEEFTWTAQKPSEDGDGDSLRREKETDKEKAGCSCHGGKKCAHARGAGQCDCKAAGKKCGLYCKCNKQICTNRELMSISSAPTRTSKEEYYSRKYTTPEGDCGHRTVRTPTDWYRTAEIHDGRNAAQQLYSPYKQPGISTAQTVYRESPELKAYHFTEKAGCSCHGGKKCAHARGAGQCDCKAAGKKCGHYCKCNKQICTNRELMSISSAPTRTSKEEYYSRKYTTPEGDCGHRTVRTPTDWYRTAEIHDGRNAAQQLYSPYKQPGISTAQTVYRESPELKAYHFKAEAGCSCHGRKKCAHARGAGQCHCKAAGKKCGYNCNCDKRICTNRW